jgi:hypothetical protein
MQNKICTKCHIEKPLSEFSKDKQKKDGYRPSCKDCTNLHYHLYYLKNKTQITIKIEKYRNEHAKYLNEKAKLYRKRNKERIKNQQKLYIQNYYKTYRNEHKLEHLEYMKIYNKKMRKENVIFKLKYNLRTRLYIVLKKNKKTTSVLKLIGCSIDFLKQHLESQFNTGMSWDNYGRNGWEVDHIRPCASFDLSKLEEQEKCFHYTNLQPLWMTDNRRKFTKYNN